MILRVAVALCAIATLTARAAPHRPTPPREYQAYVASEAADVISVIRFGPQGLTLARTLPTGLMPADIDGPHGVATGDPQGTRHYSACMMDDTLVEIDTSTLKVSRHFRLTPGAETGHQGPPASAASRAPGRRACTGRRSNRRSGGADLTHGGDDRVQVEGFAEEGGEPELACLLARIVPGGQAHDRDVSSARLLPLLAPELHAIHHRHHQIQQDEGRVNLVQLQEGVTPIRRGQHVEALQGQAHFEQCADVGVVIHDQNGWHQAVFSRIRACDLGRRVIRAQYTRKVRTFGGVARNCRPDGAIVLIHMPGKVTLYVRDEDLWRRAREASGPGGLSDLVHQLLRQWLERPDVSASAPTLLERARTLQHDAATLVRTLEADEARPRRRPQRKRRRVRP